MLRQQRGGAGDGEKKIAPDAIEIKKENMIKEQL
jgi:hypothetical protein